MSIYGVTIDDMNSNRDFKLALNNFLVTELGRKKMHFCLNFHVKPSTPPIFTPGSFPPSVKQRDGSPSGAGDSRGARGPLRAPRSAHLGCHSEEGLFFCRLLPRNLLHHHGHSLIGRPSAFALQQRNQQRRQVSSGLRPPSRALPTRPAGPGRACAWKRSSIGSRTHTHWLKIVKIIIVM